jgi:uridine kinase
MFTYIDGVSGCGKTSFLKSIKSIINDKSYTKCSVRFHDFDEKREQFPIYNMKNRDASIECAYSLMYVNDLLDGYVFSRLSKERCLIDRSLISQFVYSFASFDTGSWDYETDITKAKEYFVDDNLSRLSYTLYKSRDLIEIIIFVDTTMWSHGDEPTMLMKSLMKREYHRGQTMDQLYQYIRWQSEMFIHFAKLLIFVRVVDIKNDYGVVDREIKLYSAILERDNQDIKATEDLGRGGFFGDGY